MSLSRELRYFLNICHIYRARMSLYDDIYKTLLSIVQTEAIASSVILDIRQIEDTLSELEKAAHAHLAFDVLNQKVLELVGLEKHIITKIQIINDAQVKEKCAAYLSLVYDGANVGPAIAQRGNIIIEIHDIFMKRITVFDKESVIHTIKQDMFALHQEIEKLKSHFPQKMNFVEGMKYFSESEKIVKKISKLNSHTERKVFAVQYHAICDALFLYYEHLLSVLSKKEHSFVLINALYKNKSLFVENKKEIDAVFVKQELQDFEFYPWCIAVLKNMSQLIQERNIFILDIVNNKKEEQVA